MTAAEPHADYQRFAQWQKAGMAGEMNYLTDYRGDLRADPRHLLPSARTIICAGKIYKSAHDNLQNPYIAMYARGQDYHDVLRQSLERLRDRLADAVPEPFESRVCIDTAPLLERTYARMAGLGWIGRNTCLINQERGSWFVLGTLLTSLPLAVDQPPPERCGSCTRCIDACPTTALVPSSDGSYLLDSRHCISYLTIEKRGNLSPEMEETLGHHVFGCDICQDVCPWNQRAHTTNDLSFVPSNEEPIIEQLSKLTEDEFRHMFRKTAVWRARYRGFLRNVAAVMGNSGQSSMREPLMRLSEHSDEVVAQTARHGLDRLSKALVEQRP